jgi:hypothetical protein
MSPPTFNFDIVDDDGLIREEQIKLMHTVYDNISRRGWGSTMQYEAEHSLAYTCAFGEMK